MTLAIAPQTKIALIGYALLLIAQIMRVSSNNDDKNTTQYITGIVIFAVIAALGLYVTNCAVFGHCYLYAWIVGYSVVAMGLASICLIIYSMMKK